jgi:5'-3' exonuclease
MGIKNLYSFLKNFVPDLIKQVPLSYFSNKNIAIDVSVYIYKYICINNQSKANWIDMFINLILWLKNFNINPIFIFDGKSPQQKLNTLKSRLSNKLKTKEKLDKVENLLELLNEINIDTELPVNLIIDINSILNKDITNWSRKEIFRELNLIYKKENSKVINITPVEIHKLQNLLSYMGISWFIASGEAEKTCSWLCKYNYVDAVITTDSDVLPYSCPIFIYDIHINQNYCNVIYYNDILNILDLTHQQFIDFCILCGTDYNERIFGIGPHKAYKLICDYDNLENISIHLKINFDYNDIRNIFSLPNINDFSLLINNHFNLSSFQISKGNLIMFLLKNNSKFHINEIIFN